MTQMTRMNIIIVPRGYGFFCVLSRCGGIFVETPKLGVSTGLLIMRFSLPISPFDTPCGLLRMKSARIPLRTEQIRFWETIQTRYLHTFLAHHQRQVNVLQRGRERCQRETEFISGFGGGAGDVS